VTLLDYLETRKTGISTAQICKIFQRSESWVHRALKQLIADGLVVREKRRLPSSLANRYSFVYVSVNKKPKVLNRQKVSFNNPFNLET